MIVVRGGKKVRLDAAAVVGAGGEATVLSLDRGTVAKVWHVPTAAHARKLHMLLARRDLPPEVAAPIEALWDERETQVIGCVLPRVPDTFAPLATLLRKTPRAPVATIAQVFAALASVVAQLHTSGVIVGDLSDQNTLVRGGEVRLIDADSFQLDGEPCPVATEAYLDPALYGVALDRAPAFRPEHDRYALAVLLFRALLAVHPYGGVHPTQTTLAARATARLWALDPTVRYPRKVALPPGVLSDELLAWFRDTFSSGTREALPIGALARHAAAIARCDACGTEAPRARPACPACDARRVATPLGKSAATRIDRLLEACGDIVHVDAFGVIVHVFVDEDGQRVHYRLGGGATHRGVLGPSGRDVRAFALDAGSVIYARGEDVTVHLASGATLATTTTLFSGVPVVARAGDALVRATGGFLVRCVPWRGTFVERPLAPVLAGQTQITPGQGDALGTHRVFSRTAPFRLTRDGRVDLQVSDLAPGEALRDIALSDDGERTLVLRATTRAGVLTTRVDLLDARGALACSSSAPAELSPARAGVHGRMLRGTTLLHPTDDGIVREALVHAAVGDLSIVAGTEPICAADALLFPHPRGVLVARGRELFLVSRALRKPDPKETAPMTHPLPLPVHYDPRRIGTLYPPDVAAAAGAGERAGLPPATRDARRIALVLIDAQIDFIHPAPVGTLSVPGAVEDTRRTAEFLYRNAAEISTVIASLDSHLCYQIFYPTWWVDERGHHPAPFTVIGPDDLTRGTWRPVLDPAWSVDYVGKLAATDKKGLCVWPYHTMIGSVGHAMDPGLFEAIAYFSAARRSQPVFLTKGSIPQTEHYSVLEPEVKYSKHPQGGLNTQLLDALAKHDLVYVAGQAKSHCVLESMRSILTYFDGEPAVLDKLRLLVDCTSSVVHPQIDFDAIAEAEFARFARRGVHLVRSTDPIA